MDPEEIETKIVQPPPTSAEQWQERIAKEEQSLQVLNGFVLGAMVLVVGFSLVFLKKTFLSRDKELDLSDYAIFVFLATIIIMLSTSIEVEIMRYIVLGGAIGIMIALTKAKNLFNLTKENVAV